MEGPLGYPAAPDFPMPLDLESLHARARGTVAPFSGLFPYEPRFLDVGGRALHYVDEGPQESPNGTILCVHGNPTWSFYWRRIIEAFRGEARVVAPDHLGMGLSDRVRGGVRLEGHIDHLVALIDELDLQDITLVCHDWGGAIGFGAVMARRSRFKSFVVTNTSAFPSGDMPKRIALCRVPGAGRLAVQGGNAFARAALRMTTVIPLDQDVRKGLIAPYGSWSQREQVWRFVEDIPMKPSHPSWQTLCVIGEGLDSLRGLPMEIVWGMKDWCFTPAFKAGWQHRFPEAGVSDLEGAGHYVNEDAPEQVIHAIRRVRSRAPAHP